MAKVSKDNRARVRVSRLLEAFSHPIYPRHGNTSLLEDLLQKEEGPRGKSRQGAALGRKGHPFDFRAVIKFKIANEHHSTCIETKRDAHVGLGFKNDKVFERLDPLCEVSAQHLFLESSEDFWQTGQGYWEVVRDSARSNAPITGLHHLPAADVHVVVENKKYDRHYEINTSEDGQTRRFARFGDLEDFKLRAAKTRTGFDISAKPSEVIVFPQASSLSRWYGFPGWLACTASIEIVQMLNQHTFDFFNNRGVPEFFLFLLGKELDAAEWDSIEEAIRRNIGSGNSHKSTAVNIADPEVKVQLERLAMEGKSDGVYGEYHDTLAMNIVTAHRVPPLLAGIQIPGKLGANNELPNALMAFQALVIGQAQNHWKTILSNTLGKRALAPTLNFKPDDFNFKTILEEIDLGVADTTSRMRESVPEAKAKGRDLKAGVKKEGRLSRLPERLAPIVREAVDAALAGLLEKSASANGTATNGRSH